MGVGLLEDHPPGELRGAEGPAGVLEPLYQGHVGRALRAGIIVGQAHRLLPACAHPDHAGEDQDQTDPQNRQKDGGGEIFRFLLHSPSPPVRN